MNFARTIPSGHISSQKYVDSQTGTSDIPFALQSFRCQIIKPKQETGGQSQFCSSIQFPVKALTCNVPGQRKYLVTAKSIYCKRITQTAYELKLS